MKLTPFVLSLCFAAATYSAHADTITTLTAAPANANDAVLYLPQLGSDGDNVNSGVTALSNNGITTTITYSSAGYAYVCDQSENTCFDALPSSGGSMGVVGTAMTFSFSSGVSAVGTTFEDESAIGAVFQGPLTGTVNLALYDGAMLLGTVTQSESYATQFYVGGADSSGANITLGVLSITSESPTMIYATFEGGPNKDGASCSSIALGAFNTSTAAGIQNVLNCPYRATSEINFFNFVLPNGFCTTYATACSNFQQEGGTISPTDLSFTEEFQADSLDLVDGTPAATNLVATPEPSSLTLLGTGILSVAGVVRRRLARSA